MPLEERYIDTSTTTTTANTAEAQPVQELASNSTTMYSRPPETQPSLTTQEAVVYAEQTANNTGTTATRPPVTSPIGESTAPTYATPTTNTTVEEKPTTINATKPLLVQNVLIDPIGGTVTANKPSGGGIFGGGFGGGAGSPEQSAKSVARKSWLPVILIGIGAIVLFSKKSKKA